MIDRTLSRQRHTSPVVRTRGGTAKNRAPHLIEIHDTELSGISGGDWGDSMWGLMLGGAATAGFLGSGGFLLVAVIAGGIILLEDVQLPG
jgi:hypothetical protein